MVTTVGTGKYTYEMNEDWAHLPEGWEIPPSALAAAAVDSQDRVFAFVRVPEHPIIIFDREGNYLSHWGEGFFSEPHAIHIDKDDNVWLVDAHHGQVFKFSTQGELLMTIGTRGYQSDTGTGGKQGEFDHYGYRKVRWGGEPFNMPTAVTIAPSGEIFVSDGYSNCRVHKFSPDGKLLLSWGDPGTGPGCFKCPHGIWVDRHGRVLVCERENDRIHVFSQDGEFITIWPTHLIGPSAICVDGEDNVYVPQHNGGLFSILNLDGQPLAQWGSMIHRSGHSVSVDSHGGLYVVQPGTGGRVRRVVKFTRKG